MEFRELPAEKAFREAGPVFHLYTKPLENRVLYENDQERTRALNYLAIASMRSGARLLAYSLMSNHFHFVFAGQEAQLDAFFGDFKQLLGAYYRSHGRGGWLTGMEAGKTAILNVGQFRTTLAYVIRNAFVVNVNVNVFADPWSSGYLYFNPFLRKDGVSAASLSVRERRKFTCSRPLPGVNEDIHVLEGMAQPWSFVDYKLVMSFYDHARQYVYSVLKNVEAQTEVAISCGECPQFTGEDLLPLVYKLCREQWQAESPRALDKKGKQQLAILLKNKYFASNGQIARVTRMTVPEVNELFPMAAKAQIR